MTLSAPHSVIWIGFHSAHCDSRNKSRASADQFANWFMSACSIGMTFQLVLWLPRLDGLETRNVLITAQKFEIPSKNSKIYSTRHKNCHPAPSAASNFLVWCRCMVILRGTGPAQNVTMRNPDCHRHFSFAAAFTRRSHSGRVDPSRITCRCQRRSAFICEKWLLHCRGAMKNGRDEQKCLPLFQLAI